MCVPSATCSNGSSRSSSWQSSSRSGRKRSTTERMSGVWLPWPGKRTAINGDLQVRGTDAGVGGVVESYSVASPEPREFDALPPAWGEVALQVGGLEIGDWRLEGRVLGRRGFSLC